MNTLMYHFEYIDTDKKEFCIFIVYKYKLDSAKYVGEVFLNEKLEITSINTSRETY